MLPIERAYASSRFGQVHYRIVRPEQRVTKPPLLCMHQTPGNGGDWQAVLPALGQNSIVIAADTPGYGMSDAPPEPASIADFAAIMLDLMAGLAEAGVVPRGPFDVMGFHTGSVIATEMAASAPDRIRRAVMFGLAAYPADTREAKLANLLTNFPEPTNDLTHVEKLWAIIQQLSDPRLTAEHKHVSMAECLRLGTRMPWGYISVYRYDFLSAIPRVKQPVLIFNPEDDLWNITRDTSGRYPHGERYDMPGVKHGVLSLEHDRVVAKIEEFLTAADPGLAAG